MTCSVNVKCVTQTDIIMLSAMKMVSSYSVSWKYERMCSIKCDVQFLFNATYAATLTTLHYNYITLVH